MAEKKKLGDILKEAGLIDDFQLASALSHQRNWGGKIGVILIELGFVKESDIAKVLAERYRIPYVNLFQPEIPEPVFNMIKPDIAKKYHIIPVKKEAGYLLLAMTDPLDIEAMDAVRFITGLNIKPAFAMDSEMKDAIRKYYDHEEVVRKEQPILVQGKIQPAGKMEIIRGSDLSMHKEEEVKQESSILPREEAAQQAMSDQKLRLEALISLLIEKGLITRDEIVKMIYQKKMGL